MQTIAPPNSMRSITCGGFGRTGGEYRRVRYSQQIGRAATDIIPATERRTFAPRRLAEQSLKKAKMQTARTIARTKNAAYAPT